jgi:hypothetical protein
MQTDVLTQGMTVQLRKWLSTLRANMSGIRAIMQKRKLGLRPPFKDIQKVVGNTAQI